MQGFAEVPPGYADLRHFPTTDKLRKRSKLKPGSLLPQRRDNAARHRLRPRCCHLPARGPLMSERVRFKLFITGSSPRSDLAIGNLHRICNDELGEECDIEIIDALDRPDIAEREKVLATPTLIKEHPAPRRRVTGDLSDIQKVIQMLMLTVRRWWGEGVALLAGLIQSPSSYAPTVNMDRAVALQVSDGKVETKVLAEIMAAGRELMTHPVEPLPGVQHALSILSGFHLQESIHAQTPAQHDHASPDLRHVAEGDRGQPVDADVDLRGGLAPASTLEAPPQHTGAGHDLEALSRCPRLSESEPLTRCRSSTCTPALSAPISGPLGLRPTATSTASNSRASAGALAPEKLTFKPDFAASTASTLVDSSTSKRSLL